MNRTRRSRLSSSVRDETFPQDNRPDPTHGQNTATPLSFKDERLQAPGEGLQNEEVYRSVNASQSTMQLYYGPSSNFAFLQHIHRTLTKGPSRPTGSTDIGTNQGLDYFKQREIFFDTAPRSNLDTAAAKAGTLFLPFDQAQEFLENYLSSIHHLTPFLGPESLRQLLRRLYGQDPSESLTPARTAIMLLTLANGATLTNHSQWVEILYERAKSEAAPLEETVNLEAVQISLLLAHYQTSCGRPNSSYLQLGLACRKAYAAGLHKEVNYSLEESDASEKSEERRVTLWAVVFWERWVSFWLGRPSSVTQNALSTPMPRSRPLTLALGELSNIIAQTAHDVYGDNRLPLSRLWEVTQRVRLELRSFQRRMEPILGFRMDGSMDKGKIDADQVFMMNCEWLWQYACPEADDALVIMHTWIITFRPFLMIHLSWKRANAPHTADDDQLSSRSLPVDMWWLPEACQIAVENASRLIHFFAEAADGSNVVRVRTVLAPGPFIITRLPGLFCRVAA